MQAEWEEEIPTPTWYNKMTYSRINYIWALSELILKNLHFFQNKMVEELENSNHTLLSIKLFKNDLIDKKPHKLMQKKGIIKVITCNIKKTTDK